MQSMKEPGEQYNYSSSSSSSSSSSDSSSSSSSSSSTTSGSSSSSSSNVGGSRSPRSSESSSTLGSSSGVSGSPFFFPGRSPNHLTSLCLLLFSKSSLLESHCFCIHCFFSSSIPISNSAFLSLNGL